MIPKQIIYCWFGHGEMPEHDKYCIASWKKHCPDYEILRIDETNFDVELFDFCKQCYDNKNYAFVADFARLWALKRYGGFYLDTDTELIKSLDCLREYDAIVPLHDQNFYHNPQLGCGDFPEIYQKTLENLKDGECAVPLLNKICHEHYTLYGKELEVHDNIAFLGKHYFINNDENKDYKTIGIHYGHADWVNAWKGKYQKHKTFMPLEIYQNGIRDYEREDKYYHDAERIGTVRMDGRPFHTSIVFCGNYLYNQKIQKIVGNGFTIERYNPKRTVEIIKIGDVELYVSGD